MVSISCCRCRPGTAGFFWLLIGDQNQLPPYRHEDFTIGISRIKVILRPGSATHRFWEGLSESDQRRFVEDAKQWLFFFREVFGVAQRRPRGATPLVTMLTEQHRMHPYIGDLVSAAFYDKKLQNGTRDANGDVRPKVRHPFDGPNGLRGRAIVWIDVAQRAGSADGDGELRNAAEVDAVAAVLRAVRAPTGTRETTGILSPYRLQVAALRAGLRERPDWAALPEGFGRLRDDAIGAFTVDSFQGRQASTIIVSLVRNNTAREIHGALGFLRQWERVNVMMSRAEKLLLLVGAWEFFRTHLQQVERAEGQPFAQLGRMIDWLEAAFADGRALRIGVDDFIRENAS
jgi:superfamily I DNA and/or RNA helicase